MKTQSQTSREAIEQFKAVYRKEFGKVLTDDEVREIAMGLLQFFGVLNKKDDGSNGDTAQKQ